jgi:tRNA(fMet)-specific endonuclease VapC
MTPRYMLDTNICIYIAKKQPAALVGRFERLKPGQIVMSAVTYGELCYGAAKSQQREKALSILRELTKDIPVLALDGEVGSVYGEIRAALEKQGKLIGNDDLWIGAHALALGLTLATNNEREFRRIEGLSVENWVS